MSWTDANVGRVLDAFENTQLAEADDYVLVVWGDHGWHLGDNVSTLGRKEQPHHHISC